MIIVKKPKIRFKGFTETWEQRKFGEIVIIERGGSPRPIDKFITDDESGLNWVKIGDAPKSGNYITNTKEKIISEGLSKTREVYPGDLILSNSMSFGKPYIMGIKGCIHDGWLLIRDSNNEFDLMYLCYMLGTDTMLYQYKAMAAGSTVNNLNKELVGNTYVKYPSMLEQEQIGSFFSKLDHLITLHQRKCENLKKLKKFMLQKLFPQNGESVPKIRFLGFTDTWEQRKFKNIAERLSESYMSDDKNPSVEYEDIISELGTINKDIFNKRIRKNGIKFSNNEILYGKLRPYLHNWLKPDFNGIAVGDWWVLKPINCDREFIFRLIQTSTFDNIANQSNGTKMPRADWNLIANSDFYLPISIYEQKQIGSLFSKLDHLITLHQSKCDKLKEVKKYMLQNMFM